MGFKPCCVYGRSSLNDLGAVVACAYLHSDVGARLVSECKFLANIAVLRLVGGGTRPGWSCIIVAGATVGGFAATAGPRRPPLLSPEPPPSRTFLAGPLLPVALIPNPDAAKRVHVTVTSRAPRIIDRNAITQLLKKWFLAKIL